MFWGCDTDAVRAHADHCGQGATDVAELVRGLGAAADGVPWVGPDADAFRERMRAVVSQGTATAELLRGRGEMLVQEAEAQDEASAPDTAGPAGPVVPMTLTDDQRRDLDEMLKRASEDGGLFGNSGDVRDLTEALAALSPEDRAEYIASLSDDELRALSAALQADGGGIFGIGGLDDQTRRALLTQLLVDARPEDVERIKDAFPSLTPDPRGGGDGTQGDYVVDPNGTITPQGPVVPDDASWRDVNQGDYGDCVSMATLGMMMQQDPGWAAKHVVDNGNGTVTVTLYDENGNPDPITMPKELPATDGKANSASRDLLRSDPNAPTWPAYVERALAIQMGEGYQGIEGHGSPDVGPRLTGMEVQTLPPNDPDAAFDAARRGEPMIVGTAVSPDGKPNRPDGWVGGHGFWVEGVRTNAAGEEVIVLRNPHGAHTADVEMTREQYRQFTSSAEVHHD